jgi:hemoglobin-like flavoprotein
MTPHQQNLIKESFGMVAPIADQAATIFYARLFELDPSLQRLFANTDMAAQRKNLMQTLAVVVKSIDKLDAIVPAVQALGGRHAGYGVTPQMFTTVGEALIDTLGIGLGDAFTTECREAWVEAFEILSSVMIESMEREQSIAA